MAGSGRIIQTLPPGRIVGHAFNVAVTSERCHTIYRGIRGIPRERVARRGIFEFSSGFLQE